MSGWTASMRWTRVEPDRGCEMRKMRFSPFAPILIVFSVRPCVSCISSTNCKNRFKPFQLLLLAETFEVFCGSGQEPPRLLHSACHFDLQHLGTSMIMLSEKLCPSLLVRRAHKYGAQIVAVTRRSQCPSFQARKDLKAMAPFSCISPLNRPGDLSF